MKPEHVWLYLTLLMAFLPAVLGQMDPETDRGLNVGVEEPQEEESRISEVIKRRASSAEMAQKQ